jgi:hypothetical protein
MREAPCLAAVNGAACDLKGGGMTARKTGTHLAYRFK